MAKGDVYIALIEGDDQVLSWEIIRPAPTGVGLNAAKELQNIILNNPIAPTMPTMPTMPAKDEEE